jgi:hypothetical protein
MRVSSKSGEGAAGPMLGSTHIDVPGPSLDDFGSISNPLAKRAAKVAQHARPKSSDKLHSKLRSSPPQVRKKPSGLGGGHTGKQSPRPKQGPIARRQKKHRKEMLGHERIDNRFEDDHNFLNSSKYVEEVQATN